MTALFPSLRRAFWLSLLFLVATCSFAQDGATIEKVWLDHGVVQNGVTGMKVHAKFEINGYKGKSCNMIAFINSPKGVGVNDLNGNYCTPDGKVGTFTDFCPGYDRTTYSGYTAFFPNTELHLLPGKRTYYCIVQLFHN